MNVYNANKNEAKLYKYYANMAILHHHEYKMSEIIDM